MLSSTALAMAWGVLCVGQIGCSGTCPPGTMVAGNVCKRIDANSASDAGTGDAAGTPGAGGTSGTASHSTSGSGGSSGDASGTGGAGGTAGSAGTSAAGSGASGGGAAAGTAGSAQAGNSGSSSAGSAASSGMAAAGNGASPQGGAAGTAGTSGGAAGTAGPRCGNNMVEPGEICDANCPASCDDGNACTTDTLTGSAAACSAKCTNAPITTCKSGDGCCAPGCINSNDNDCAPPPPHCGDGHVNPGEVCDGNCPTSCDDRDPCTDDKQTGGAATCDLVCTHPAKTPSATTMDGCCPKNADATTDADCTPVCGNGVVERGESCDTKLQNTFECSPDCVARKIYTVCDVGQSGTCATNVQCDQGVCAPLAPNYTKNACPVPTGYSASQIGIYYAQYCAISCNTVSDCPPQLTVCMDNPFLASDAREVAKYCTTKK